MNKTYAISNHKLYIQTSMQQVENSLRITMVEHIVTNGDIAHNE